MPDKEKEIETEVDDLDDLLFGPSDEEIEEEDDIEEDCNFQTNESGDEILTPEVKKVIKAFEEESNVEIPKDEFVDQYFKPTVPDAHIDGGPNATLTHEASGHKRRNRKLMRRFP